MKKCFTFLSVAFLILLTACQSETAGEAEKPETEVEQKSIDQTHSNDVEGQSDKEETAPVPKWEKVETIVHPSTETLQYEFSDEEPIFTKHFPQNYQDVNGILTFRSGPFRNNAFHGDAEISQATLGVDWSFQTSSSPRWGGGAGWTGQASIIEWEESEKQIMNLLPEFKDKKDFKEIVYGSLDGNIYFLDYDSGKPSREPINIGNPIKGSVSLDPRGYPLLYVGQGIPQSGEIGYRIFSLIDSSRLTFIPGIDGYAYRSWGAFDGSALIHKEEDALILAGENGLVYSVKLNTDYKPDQKTISINPEIQKYRYKQTGNSHQGVESSVAVYKNIAYFADNAGGIQAIDILKNTPIWANLPYDDTDATIVIHEENETPFIFTASQIDKQGSEGEARVQKLNGLDGSVVWEHFIPGFSLLGQNPVNGGALATPIIGEGPLEGQIIFNIARFKQFNSGLLISYNIETGDELWRWEMPNYAWSSPVAVYSTDGNAYIIQGDSTGNMYLLNETGELLHDIHLGANIEASPIVYDNKIIVATRGGQIYSILIQ